MYISIIGNSIVNLSEIVKIKLVRMTKFVNSIKIKIFIKDFSIKRIKTNIVKKKIIIRLIITKLKDFVNLYNFSFRITFSTSKVELYLNSDWVY